MERRRANEDRQCKLCAFHTHKMDSLKIHIETIHKILAFVCSECDFKTFTKQSVDVHKQAKHEGIVSRCKVCDKIVSSANLSYHMQAMHRQKEIKCDNCHYITNTKRSLTKHDLMNHAEKIYSCDICVSHTGEGI